jgi:hypothetical protein
VGLRTVADRPPFRQVLGITDTSTGRLLRRLHSGPWDGMQVFGTTVDGRGRVWVTLSAGPRFRDNSLGGNPQPDSCRSEVLRIDPSGAVHVVLRGRKDVQISQATPSPDGFRLAYLTAPCARWYENQSIRVDDLGSGRHITIGAGLMPCHLLSAPRWSPDGRTLAFAYGPSDPTPDPVPHGSNVCLTPLPSRVAVVPADHAQAFIGGSTVPAPDSGCEIATATPDAAGVAAVEACGGDAYLSGPVRLLRYSPTLRLLDRTPIGKCANGTEIVADHTGTKLLVSSYQFCNPPGVPDSHTVVYTASASRGPATLQGTHPGGFQNPSDISW